MNTKWNATTIVLAAIAITTVLTPDALADLREVTSRAVTIWSDGTRLAGDLHYPADAKEGEKFPAIVLCHGWGGVKSHLNRTYGPKFAAGGFVVLAFDYRGWGDSDSRLVVHGVMPAPDDKGYVTVTAQAIRELVDPFDQLEDIRNAINFIEGESMVDTSKIGIWGTSFGGGLVLQTALDDSRVKCVVSQVGAVDAREAAESAYGSLEATHQNEIARSRGEAPPVPQGEKTFEGLRGTPHVNRFARYAPIEGAHELKVPILIIDAEDEELFDLNDHGAKLYNIVKDKVEAKRHVEPGITHYGIYSTRYPQGSTLALEWFQKHLK